MSSESSRSGRPAARRRARSSLIPLPSPEPSSRTTALSAGSRANSSAHVTPSRAWTIRPVIQQRLSERIAILKTTDTTAIHRDCYREARERFRLPASTIQQARDKAVSAYRSYLEWKKRDRRCKPPTFRRTLPLRLAAENLRVFADKTVVRVTTPDGFLWLPLIVPLY